MPGGKGGFGSMLRAIGAQIEKTTNREACRDLSGRRLRDVNAEKRIKEWIAKKAQREEEAAKKKKEKLEKLKREPQIYFQDDEYFKQREEIPDRVDDAIEYALKKKKQQQASSAAGCSKDLEASQSATSTSDDNSNSNQPDEAVPEAKPEVQPEEIKAEPAKRKLDDDSGKTDKSKKLKGNLWLGDVDEEDLSDEDE